MKYITNSGHRLTESALMNAMRGNRGEFMFSQSGPALVYQNCIFEIPEGFHQPFRHLETLDGEEWEVPSPDHPLHLIWDCMLHRIASQTRGYLYLLRCERYYKVGITGDLKARMVTYRTENPFPIHLVFAASLPGHDAIEKAICRFYRHLQHRGEWFRLGRHEVRVISRILSIEGVGEPNPETTWYRRNMELVTPGLHDTILKNRFPIPPGEIRVEDLPF